MNHESTLVRNTTTVIPSRYLLVVLTFLLSLLLYIDRACISAATDSIRPALGFTEKQMGWVMSAFALGYALFQTPGGLLADRFGPRLVLAAVVGFWSLFTGLTAAAWSYVSMLVVRFLFGAGEAGAFPTMARAFYTWIPMPERGRVQGINFSGSRLGAAFALPVVAWMITAFGWRATFVTWAVLCGSATTPPITRVSPLPNSTTSARHASRPRRITAASRNSRRRSCSAPGICGSR
jgi:ACS family glucarate transporter-like MFS transporter